MAIQPLQNRILIQQAKDAIAMTASGIILGEERAPQSIKANVLAVGPDCKLVKVGDLVLVSQFSPTEARESQTDKTLIANEDDVLGIIVPTIGSKPVVKEENVNV